MWVYAVVLVFCSSLLLRVLLFARFHKQAIAPWWLAPALTAALILAVACLFGTMLPRGNGG